MRTILIALALILALSSFACAAAEVVIYNGDAETDRGGIALGAWGSGHVAESYEVHYIGPRVLKVLSQGYYQGGVLTFKNPVPLEAFAFEPDSYLEFLVKPAVVLRQTQPQAAPTTGASTRQPAAGASTRPTRGGMMPGGAARRGGAGTAARQPGTPQTGKKPAEADTGKPAFLLRSFRVMLITDKGQMMVDGWPIRNSVLTGGGWRRIAVPLSAFKSPAGEQATLLKGLRLFADRADIFYIGQIRLMVDTTPLRAKVTAKPARAEAGSAVAFQAAVDAGNASTLISWDFDASDGIQVQAQGAKVEWRYEKIGEYVVTCTVSDIYGTKEAVSETAKIVVF
jgi:hypothetical protein